MRATTILDMNSTGSSTDWTFLRLLEWTTRYFEKSGLDDPRLNAELLLSEAAGLERIMLYARYSDMLSPRATARFREMVARRARRCPLQYVIGKSEFYGREFVLSPAVMVPRPETEQLVEKCLGLLSSDSESFLTADIATGSGVIAVSLACERREIVCYATDISAGAIEVASANARRHGVDERVRFFEGDLLGALPREAGRGRRVLDLLASNPPYIPAGEIENLEPEVSRWEPREALDGGEDGLEVINRLLEGAADVLKPGGWLVLELGAGQSDRVRTRIETLPRWCSESVEVTADTGGHDRVLSVMAI